MAAPRTASPRYLPEAATPATPTVPTALVLGSNGQDGTLLCRRLLDAGHEVIGVGLARAPSGEHDASRFLYVPLDLRGPSAPLADLLAAKRPHRVFHFAAVHASAVGACYEPAFEAMLAVNVRSVHTVLEHLRLVDPAARLVYASSSKVFGVPLPARVDEASPRSSPCLYSLTKNAAGDLVRYYRRVHGTLASQVFLFNHESDRRPPEFFLPKLARCLGAARRGEPVRETFTTLDFHGDWGSADEYMGIVAALAERAPGEDFVLATGHTVHARQLVERLFSAVGASADGLAPAPGGLPPTPFQADIGKLRSIGLEPRVLVEALVEALAAGPSNRVTPAAARRP